MNESNMNDFGTFNNPNNVGTPVDINAGTPIEQVAVTPNFPQAGVVNPVSPVVEPKQGFYDKINAMKQTLGVNQYLLPVGVKGEDGLIHRVITFKPMTGRTDEILADPKGRDNSFRQMVDAMVTVIESIEGVRKITRDVIRSMDYKDFEFILACNYLTSFDETITFTEKHKDGSCNAVNEIEANIQNIVDDAEYRDEDEDLKVRVELKDGVKGLDGITRYSLVANFPTVGVQEQVFKQSKQNVIQGMNKLFLLTVESIGDLTRLNPDTFKCMTKRDRNIITKAYSEQNKAGVDLVAKIICSGCGDEIEVPISAMALLGE